MRSVEITVLLLNEVPDGHAVRVAAVFHDDIVDILAFDFADEGMRLLAGDADPAPSIILLGVDDGVAGAALGAGQELLVLDGVVVAPDALGGVAGSEPFEGSGEDGFLGDAGQRQRDEIVLFRGIDRKQEGVVFGATVRRRLLLLSRSTFEQVAGIVKFHPRFRTSLSSPCWGERAQREEQ